MSEQPNKISAIQFLHKFFQNTEEEEILLRLGLFQGMDDGTHFIKNPEDLLTLRENETIDNYLQRFMEFLDNRPQSF
jgi:hypothetical protein